MSTRRMLEQEVERLERLVKARLAKVAIAERRLEEAQWRLKTHKPAPSTEKAA